ncbi:MAG: cysteine desulfurase family protein [Sphaerochaetaceae bacterium]
MNSMLYFDNAATTKISEVALAAYDKVSEEYWANPSSLHREGQKAKQRLEDDRNEIARYLGVPASTLTFTSGATEANGIILQNLLWAPKSQSVIIPSIEHNAVRGYERLLREKGWDVVSLDAPRGFINPRQLESALSDQTRLVCCMLVNNVLGTVQMVEELVQVVRNFQMRTGRKIHVHTDATQALGKVDFNLTKLGVDSAAFSAHKLQGPRGIGLLYNTDSSLVALSQGGEQERSLRPGTENLPAIEAMTVAIKDAFDRFDEHQQRAQEINALVRASLGEVVNILTPKENSSPYILNISTNKFPSEVFTRMLYDQNCCVSSGSACSNNAKQKAENVLSAMKFPPSIAKGSIRLSFGYDTTVEQAQQLCTTIRQLIRM